MSLAALHRALEDRRRASTRCAPGDAWIASASGRLIARYRPYLNLLYKPAAVFAQNVSIFDALNQAGATMRMRWRWKDGWLQLRSTS